MLHILFYALGDIAFAPEERISLAEFAMLNEGCYLAVGLVELVVVDTRIAFNHLFYMLLICLLTEEKLFKKLIVLIFTQLVHLTERVYLVLSLLKLLLHCITQTAFGNDFVFVALLRSSKHNNEAIGRIVVLPRKEILIDKYIPLLGNTFKIKAPVKKIQFKASVGTAGYLICAFDFNESIGNALTRNINTF